MDSFLQRPTSYSKVSWLQFHTMPETHCSYKMSIEVVNCYMCETKVWILANGLHVLPTRIYSSDGLPHSFDHELIEKLHALFHIRLKNRLSSSHGQPFRGRLRKIEMSSRPMRCAECLEDIKSTIGKIPGMQKTTYLQPFDNLLECIPHLCIGTCTSMFLKLRPKRVPG